MGSTKKYTSSGDWFDANFSTLKWEVLPTTGVYSSVTNGELSVTFNNAGNYTLRCYMSTPCGTGGTAYLVVSVGIIILFQSTNPEKQLQSHKMRPETRPILSSRMSC